MENRKTIEDEIRRVRWACHRGMWELDLLLLPFVEANFQNISAEDRALFCDLLILEDPVLFQAFFKSNDLSGDLIDVKFHGLIKQIKQYANSAD